MDDATLLINIGTAVRHSRLALNLSQERFADSIGMHRAQYGKIERGLVNLTVITMARLAAGLGISLADLMKIAKL